MNTTETKQKLGPRQQFFVNSLKKNGHRQLKNALGMKTGNKEYKACCLGEATICINRLKKKQIFNSIAKNGFIVNSVGGKSVLSKYEKDYYKFINLEGKFLKDVKHEVYGAIKSFRSLISLNDGDVPWKEIAEIIERDPSNVFTEEI